MTLRQLRGYIDELPSLQAELTLILFTATSFPNLKERERKKTLRKIEDLANKLGGERRELVAPPALLRLMGVSVRLPTDG